MYLTCIFLFFRLLVCYIIIHFSVDKSDAFKRNWLTNKMDGSEDDMVSSRLKRLVGDEFIKWREELRKEVPAASMKELMESITPPEGVRRVEHDERRDLNYIPHDEGKELFDCDGDELELEVIIVNSKNYSNYVFYSDISIVLLLTLYTFCDFIVNFVCISWFYC